MQNDSLKNKNSLCSQCHKLLLVNIKGETVEMSMVIFNILYYDYIDKTDFRILYQYYAVY